MKEIGTLVCRKKDGTLVRNGIHKGDQSSVNVSLKCPPGSRREALWHTHPSGSLQLSSKDIKTGKEHDIPFVCVSNGKKNSTRCYPIRKR